MRPLLFHPSRETLRAWLHGEDGDAKLDAHIAICRRCATTLEGLDADLDSEDADGAEPERSDALAGALSAALAPPVDLSTRLEARVTQRLDSRVMFGVLSDLFAAGVETSRMLILEETDDHD